MRIGLVLGALVISLIMASLSTASPAQANVGNLPNLIPYPASDLSIETTRSKTYLRLATTSWNNGAGALEIRGGHADRKAGRQQVFQRIFDGNGGHQDVEAGWFTYHKQHRHIHFDDYATFSLESISSPETKATGSKQSFCIIDTDKVDTSLPGAPLAFVYGTCNSQRQGMSVGWGDTYGAHLAGQSIDITKLPDGDYNLITTVDPTNKLVEVNEADNTSTVKVRIQSGQVSIL